MTDTLPIDRHVAGVGRIARRSGTTNPAVLRKINRTIDRLIDDGRLDLLHALKNRRVTPMQLHDLFTRKQLHTIPSADAAIALIEWWTTWMEGRACSPAHKRSLAQSLRHLAPRKDATIFDVPMLLEKARVTLKGHPQSFRLLRAACQSFVKSQLKRSSPVYAAVCDVEPLTRGRVIEKHPMAVDELRDMLKRLPLREARMAESVALHGFRIGEYYGNWEVKGDRVLIRGTKTRGSNRFVPYMGVCVPAGVGYQTFRSVLRGAGGVTPYDLRRTYAGLLELAQVPRTRRKLYLGHQSGDVTDLYERHEVERFLAEDREKLQALIGVSVELKLVKERA